jgi:hypothetical protein
LPLYHDFFFTTPLNWLLLKILKNDSHILAMWHTQCHKPSPSVFMAPMFFRI